MSGSVVVPSPSITCPSCFPESTFRIFVFLDWIKDNMNITHSTPVSHKNNIFKENPYKEIASSSKATFPLILGEQPIFQPKSDKYQHKTFFYLLHNLWVLQPFTANCCFIWAGFFFCLHPKKTTTLCISSCPCLPAPQKNKRTQNRLGEQRKWSHRACLTGRTTIILMEGVLTAF